jgi:hypothetical protein
MDTAGIITAVGGVLALLLKAGLSAQPRKKKKAADVAGRLESLEARLELAESRLLGWAAWAHDARVTSAASGIQLPKIPARLLGTDEPTIPAPRGTDESAERTDV